MCHDQIKPYMPFPLPHLSHIAVYVIFHKVEICVCEMYCEIYQDF